MQKGSKPVRKPKTQSVTGVRPVDKSQATKGKLDYVKARHCILSAKKQCKASSIQLNSTSQKSDIQRATCRSRIGVAVNQVTLAA